MYCVPGTVGVLNRTGPYTYARDGPLWFRGYARPRHAALTEEGACEELAATLAAVGSGARRMAVGHNIVPFIASRCDGALQLLDVGMSYAYEGAWRLCRAFVRAAPSHRALSIGARQPPDGPLTP